VRDRSSPGLMARRFSARRTEQARALHGAKTRRAGPCHSHWVMSAQREELLRLVEELPEEEVPAVLDDVRRHLRTVSERPWPPAWFGAGEGSAENIAARSEDLLGNGFLYEHPVLFRSVRDLGLVSPGLSGR